MPVLLGPRKLFDKNFLTPNKIGTTFNLSSAFNIIDD